MAIKKQNNNLLQLADVGALILSAWFVYSVIQNARDLIEAGVKNAPASYGLILALLLVVYSSYQQKKLNIPNVITLTVLATSAIIWLLGLSTRALN